MLVLHVLVSIGFVQTVGQDHRAVELDREFLASSEPLSVLVAGSSHARNAIAAEELGGASIAVAGEHPVKTRFRLPWLLDRTDRPIGAVILELDAVSVAGFKADDYGPEYIWGRYVPFLRIGMLRGAPLPYAGKWAKAHLAPYAGEWGNVMLWRAGRRAFRDENRADRFQRQAPNWVRKTGEEAARVHFEGVVPYDPMKVWAFRELVNNLRQREMHVVVVRFPVTREYAAAAEGYGATPDLLDDVMEPLLSPGEVDQIDLSHLLDDRPDAFYDGDHVGRGWRQVVSVLRQELRGLGIRTSR